MFTFLRSIRQLNQPLIHLRQQTLVLGTLLALLLALGGELLLPTLRRADAAPRLQESPLSPLTPANATTPITVTDTGTDALTGMTATTAMTVGAPLPSTAVTGTETVPVEVAPVEITPAEASSPLPTATVPAEPTSLAASHSASALSLLTTVLASGQVSLVLVAALFVGLFTVIGVVLGRRPQ